MSEMKKTVGISNPNDQAGSASELINNKLTEGQMRVCGVALRRGQIQG